MTWAKNYGDRFNTSAEPGKRARAIKKVCGDCGTGIDSRKSYCSPCYDVRLEGFNKINRAKYVERQKAKKAASIVSPANQGGPR